MTIEKIKEDMFYQMFCMHPEINLRMSTDDDDFIVEIGDFKIQLDEFDFGLMMEKMQEISNAAQIALNAWEAYKAKVTRIATGA